MTQALYTIDLIKVMYGPTITLSLTDQNTYQRYYVRI